MRKLAVAIGLVGCLWLPGAPAEANWEWSGILYGWMSNIGMDIKSPDQVGGVDIDFKDLLDKVDFVFQGHLEGRRGKGGLLFDLTYIKVGKSQSKQGFTLFPNLELTMLEVGGLYSPTGTGEGFDLIYGIRVIDMKQDVEIEIPGQLNLRLPIVDVSKTYTDALLGFRYTAPVGKRGSFIFRADLGAGGTELTFNGTAGFGIGLGKSGKYSLLLGYRHMQIELEEDRVTTDLTMSGPILGFKIGR